MGLQRESNQQDLSQAKEEVHPGRELHQLAAKGGVRLDWEPVPQLAAMGEGEETGHSRERKPARTSKRRTNTTLYVPLGAYRLKKVSTAGKS